MGFDEQSGMVNAGAGKKADGKRKMPNDERGKTPFAVFYALLCFALFCFTLFFLLCSSATLCLRRVPACAINC